MQTIDEEVIKYIQAHKEDFLPSASYDNKIGAVNLAHEVLSKDQFSNFIYTLDSAGFDTLDLRQNALLVAAKEYCDYCLSHPQYEDRSNAWSRLQYVLCGIGDFALNYPEQVDAFKSMGTNYGFNLKPLPEDCGWEGEGDYDLGWFNVDEFRKDFAE